MDKMPPSEGGAAGSIPAGSTKSITKYNQNPGKSRGFV